MEVEKAVLGLYSPPVGGELRLLKQYATKMEGLLVSGSIGLTAGQNIWMNSLPASNNWVKPTSTTVSPWEMSADHPIELK